MRTEQTDWLIVADEGGATLLQCSLMAGRRHVEQTDTLENQWLPEASGPPSSLSAAKTEHGYASPGHVKEEHQRRYAQHLAQWTARHVQTRGLKEIIIVAPARLQAWLRSSCPPGLLSMMRQVNGDFRHIPVPELGDHPAIHEWFAPAAK